MFPWLQISLLKALEFEGQVQSKRIQVNTVQTEFLDLLLEQDKIYLCAEFQLDFSQIGGLILEIRVKNVEMKLPRLSALLDYVSVF